MEQREEATKPSEREMRGRSELEGYPVGEDQAHLDRQPDRERDLHLYLRRDHRLDPHLDCRLVSSRTSV